MTLERYEARAVSERIDMIKLLRVVIMDYEGYNHGHWETCDWAKRALAKLEAEPVVRDLGG